MKTREQAEQRALELYPDTHISIVNQLHEVSRQAYLKGWEESQDTKLREAAELVVDLWNYEDAEIDRPTFHFSMDILEKELK